MLAAGTAGSIAGLGVEYAVTRATVRGEPWRSSMVKTAPIAAALGAALCVVMVSSGTLATYLHLGGAAPVRLSAVLFAVSVLSAAPSGLLVGQQRITTLAILAGGSAVVRVALLWVVPGSWVERVLICSIVAVVLGGVAQLVAGARRVAIPGQTESSPSSTSLFGSFVIAGSVAQVVLWLTVVAPMVLARHFLTSTAAGELATVTFVASSLAYLAGPVATAFFPIMVADRAWRHVRKGLLLSVAITALGTVALVLTGPTLLRILYHTSQPHIAWLLLLSGLATTVQVASGYLVWSALARHDAVWVVGVGSILALAVMVWSLSVWHGSGIVLLVAALPSTAVPGLVALVFGGSTRAKPLANEEFTSQYANGYSTARNLTRHSPGAIDRSVARIEVPHVPVPVPPGDGVVSGREAGNQPFI
jgi:hypothetical protein